MVTRFMLLCKPNSKCGLCNAAADDVMKLLVDGSQRRGTASTAANVQSSRSHSIFTADIEAIMPAKDGLTRVRFSRLNLVDLAGTNASVSNYTSEFSVFVPTLRRLTCVRFSRLNLVDLAGVALSRYGGMRTLRVVMFPWSSQNKEARCS